MQMVVEPLLLQNVMQKRVEYAQSVGANVYVSMHINAGGGNGAEIFYPNQNYRSDLGTTGHDLAQQILNKIFRTWNR